MILGVLIGILYITVLIAAAVFLVNVLWRTMKAIESMARAFESMARSLKHLAANKTQSDPH